LTFVIDVAHMLVYLYYLYFTYQPFAHLLPFCRGAKILTRPDIWQAPFMGWDNPLYPLGQPMLRCYQWRNYKLWTPGENKLSGPPFPFPPPKNGHEFFVLAQIGSGLKNMCWRFPLNFINCRGLRGVYNALYLFCKMQETTFFVWFIFLENCEKRWMTQKLLETTIADSNFPYSI
jgi:hypothetical protein